MSNGKEKEIFDRILEHLIQAGLIKKNEIQRIDATHVIADVAIPTMVTQHMVTGYPVRILRQRARW